MARKLSLLVTAGLALAGPVTSAQTAPASETPPAPTPDADAPLAEREELTGNWGGLRDDLAAAGLTVAAENVLEASTVFAGGVDEDASLRNLFTLGLELDTAPGLGVEGGTFFVQYLSVTAERGGSGDAGDLQGFSNLENDRSLDVIYELWYEQKLFDERLRIKVGKIDANSEFAAVAPIQAFSAAGELTHSSAGFVPTILGFPSYPDPATSVNVFVTPVRGDAGELTFGYGFYDGAAGVDGVPTGSRGPSTFFSNDRSDDYFHIAELQWSWPTLAGLPDGGLSVGGWYHGGAFPTFSGGTDTGTAGAYATIQQRLTAPADPDAEDGLYVFAQLGVADEDVTEVARLYAAGLVQVGLGTARPADLLGLYASLAELSDTPGTTFDGDELAIEAFYRAQLTPAVYLQPGLQLIVNPGGDAILDDALVGQLRLGVTF
ncbi:MAG: carbohydrate porin [Planctomycetota bacterium]